MLLKRGQPPLSSMLLGGGESSTGEAGGGSGWDVAPSLQGAEGPNANADGNTGEANGN